MSAQVFMSYATIVLLVMASLLHLACIRDRTIYLTRAGTTARFLMAVGLIVLATRFGFFVYDHGALEIPIYVLSAHCFIALGMIVYDLHRFAPFHWMDTRPHGPETMAELIDSDLPIDKRRHERRKSSVHTPRDFQRERPQP